MSRTNVSKWHEILAAKDPSLLAGALADDSAFHSPVVHTPQKGKELVTLYLTGAMHVLGSTDFHYVREVVDGNDAVLEFECELDGIHVNGVDMIRWNDDGEIVDFKVMIRPLKAIQLLHRKMGEMLEALK